MQKQAVFIAFFLCLSSLRAQSEDNNNEGAEVSQGIYFSGNIGISLFQGPNFTLHSGNWDYKDRFIPNRNLFEEANVSIGRRVKLGDKTGLRYEGRLQWIKFSFNGSSYDKKIEFLDFLPIHFIDSLDPSIVSDSSMGELLDHLQGLHEESRFDFPPVDYETLLNPDPALSVFDTTKGLGLIGGVYYDYDIKRQEYDTLFYVGTGLGLMRTNSEGSVDILGFPWFDEDNDSHWVKIIQAEFGALLGLSRQIDLKISYQITHTGGFRAGNGQSFAFIHHPFIRHTVQLGLLHFFKKR